MFRKLSQGGYDSLKSSLKTTTELLKASEGRVHDLEVNLGVKECKLHKAKEQINGLENKQRSLVNALEKMTHRFENLLMGKVKILEAIKDFKKS